MLKTTSNRPFLNALVLAGGSSSRMGFDKSAIRYHRKPQLEHLADLLNGFVENIFISCSPERVPDTNHPVIEDTFHALGPMGGVLSAFQHHPDFAWMVVACDMPLVDLATISMLIRERDASMMATCFLDPDTQLPEPLLTIWEPAAYAVLLDYVQKGNSSLRDVLSRENCKVIQINIPQVLRNANTPEESMEMERIIRYREN